MSINTNDGTGLKDLPATLSIPSNVGKLDVGAIYDRVAQGLQNSTAIGQNANQQVADQAVLANRAQQANANTSLIPSTTAATLAQNQGITQQTPLNTAILAANANKATATNASSIQATNSANDLQSAQNQVAQIYADAGLKVAPELAADTATLQSGLYKRLKDSGGGMVTAPITGPGGQSFGTMLVYTGPDGQPKTQIVPVPYGQLSHINTGIQYTPIGQKIDPATNQPVGMQWQTIYPNAAGGITRGEIVTTGLNEGPPGQVYQAPGTQTPAASVSPAIGPSGVAQGQAVQPQTGAAPAVQPAPAPAPAPTPTDPNAAALAAENAPPAPAGSPAPQPAPAVQPGAAPAPAGPAAPAQPVAAAQPVPGGRIGAQIAAKQTGDLIKDRREFLEGLSAEQDDIQTKQNAIQKLDADIAAEKNATLAGGPVVGTAARALGLAHKTPTGQQVDTDTSNFIGETMKNAKNIRTQQEFNAYSGSIPKADQYPDVQQRNADRMKQITDVRAQRVAFMQQEAARNPNFTPSELEKQAIDRFPLSGGSVAPPPDAGGGASAATTPSPGTIHVTGPQGTFEITPDKLQQFQQNGYQPVQ